ncbi:hypothetical protein HPG69_011264 [Diceros bicornis minor]|uniref:Myelin and lymphocyte protein n=1 Tax=Diceros bicornis minor TaxID=77932 RepID=A0A7J7FE07_DICBM|nr:hypothetical protein HPG69_011264 [Diceros bicornis minor]
MFVSVSCFIGTTALLFLYLTGANKGNIPWDTAYHCIAALFYLSTSFLEALATISMEDSVTYEQYLENISAAMFSYIATLLYVVHAVFSVVRWKWPLLDDS